VSRDDRQLIATCPYGDWLIAVGPDSDRGGRVTLRWHRKVGRGSPGTEQPGYHTDWLNWPLSDEAKQQDGGATEVLVGCRHLRRVVIPSVVGELYDVGLRGRKKWDYLWSLRSGQQGLS
jgi:hypothetical protein